MSYDPEIRNQVRLYNEALLEEQLQVRRYWRNHSIKLTDICFFKKVDNNFLYYGKTWNVGEDGIGFPAGVNVLLSFNGVQTRGVFLAYDTEFQFFYFSGDDTIQNHHYLPKEIIVEGLTHELLNYFIERLKIVETAGVCLGRQVIKNEFLHTSPEYKYTDRFTQYLNNSQQDAIRKIYRRDVSFLWGPPGTGKTTTLAALILDLLSKKKRILAVSLSNVAVDELALKLIASADLNRYQFKDGEIMRFGHPKLQDVYNYSILFPSGQEVDNWRQQIYGLKKELQEESKPEKKAELQQKINSRQILLKNAITDSLNHAKLTLTTIFQVVIEAVIKSQHYDVMIIDEASMISVCHMAVVSLLAKEKLIISGDYKQLGPIVVSGKPETRKILCKNPFDMVVNQRYNQHPMATLEQQHRMHEKICDVVNEYFYDNVLQTQIQTQNRIGALQDPGSGEPLVFKEVTPADGSKVELDNSSRYNTLTASIAAKIAASIVLRSKCSVKIITPYRKQSYLIQRHLREMSRLEIFMRHHGDRLKVGTVHSFQGAEADVIIFDMVDNRVSGPGKLYQQKTGEYLVNVAISRAKGKLIVIGDPCLFKNISSDGCRLIKKLFEEVPFVRI